MLVNETNRIACLIVFPVEFIHWALTPAVFAVRSGWEKSQLETDGDRERSSTLKLSQDRRWSGQIQWLVSEETSVLKSISDDTLDVILDNI